MTITLRYGPNEKMIELGGGSCPQIRPNVDVRPIFTDKGEPLVDMVADFEKPLPLDSDHYDGVFSKFMLEHISYPVLKNQLLKEIYRILKPGGRFVAVTPNTEAQLQWIQKNPNGWDGKDAFTATSEILYGSQDYSENAHKCFLSPGILTKLLTDAGFENVVIKAYGERSTDMCAECTKPVLQAKEKTDSIEGVSREELFDKHYFNGGQKVGGYAGEGYRDFLVHEITAQLILAEQPESVLELGTSRGYILKRLQDAGVHAEGIEISKHCYLTRACDGITQWDLCQTPWPFADKQFDLSTSTAVLEHIPEEFIDAVAAEINRVSKRGLHGIDLGEQDDGWDKTHCFPAGTLILYSDGSSKPIEDVNSDDIVLGVSPDGALVDSVVCCAKSRFAEEFISVTLSNGGTISMTEEHPVFVFKKGWTKAKDINSGDCVYVIEIKSESDRFCEKQLHDHELSRNGGSSECEMELATALCGFYPEPQKGEMGENGVERRGETHTQRQLCFGNERSDDGIVAKKEMERDHAYGSKNGLSSSIESGVPGSSETAEHVSRRVCIHCRNNRRGGFGFSAQSEKSAAREIDEEVRSSKAKEDRVSSAERIDGMQHRQEDDRFHSSEVRRNNLQKKPVATGHEPVDSLCSQYSRIQSVTDDSGYQAVHDNQAETCDGSGGLHQSSIVKRQECSTCGRRMEIVPQVEKVMSTQRVRRVGQPVYNLKTSTENYVANGILVHNCAFHNLPWWQHKLGETQKAVNKEAMETGSIPASYFTGDGKVKVNIGSHLHMFHHGWLNMDVVDLREYAHQNKYRFMRHDVLRGLPFATEDVDMIFSSHMLEHFTYADGLKFLRECRRVLKPGGLIRLIVPDCEKLMDECHQGTIRLQFAEISDGVENAKTEMQAFYELAMAHHLAMYDRETMFSMLEQAGFLPLPACFRGSDSVQMLKETVDGFPEISLYVEGRVPVV